MRDIRFPILIFSWISAGVAMYMAFHNVRLRLRFKLPRRLFYALTYFCAAIIVWEVTVFVVAPSPAIPGDLKGWVYLFALLGFSIGIVGVGYDHAKRRKDLRRFPPAG